MTKNSRYLYINIYLFAYLLGRVTVKYSIVHFTVVCLVSWPLSGSEAEVTLF